MTFDEIKKLPGQSLVMFYSLTCGPCKAMKPMLIETCAEAGLALHQVNIASDMDAVRALGIRGVPSLVKVADGVPTLLSTGGLSTPQTRELLVGAGLLGA
jgi:thioredoxin-like negative regulator of GroEL